MPKKMQWIWRSLIASFIACLIVVTAIASQPTNAAIAPLLDPYLTSGKLSEGEKAFSDYLQSSPKDDKSRFGLGVIQFVRGTERLMQSAISLWHDPKPSRGIDPLRAITNPQKS